jgi:CheY-like chemotaxis protein
LEKLLRVLIVEDDAFIASLLIETVNGLGHVVCAVAATEDDAVDYAYDRQPDLMIVDAGLVAGNGVSAMKTILQHQNTPHLFVTGNARSVRDSFPDATILQKPFFVPELIAAIDRAVGQAASA